MVRDTAVADRQPAATATLNNASITNNTANVSASTPTLVSPADAARVNTATPTLSATFLDPDSQDTGKVTFEVCTTNNCSSSLGTFDSTSTNLAVNANGSAAVPAGLNLASGTTYYWRAENVDSSAAGSSWTSTRSFLVDTTAPTMSSATVAADGTTVTVTWSENLDQTEAVPGSSFSIAPNGGAGIAGTATAVSYTAANQTRFTLSSAVHHLDSLALTYTKPGSGPMARDTALATGNAASTATLNNASITNNTTNAAPSTPTFVSPADAARLNTTTPTLTATFGDPDPQDTGKVTFEVCTTSNCSSSLGTFDSTSTTLTVGVERQRRRPGRLQPRQRQHLLLARQERRRLRGRLFVHGDAFVPRRHRGTDHELGSRRRRRRHRHRHLVGEPRPDPGGSGHRLLDRTQRRHRNRGHGGRDQLPGARTRRASRSSAPCTTSTRWRSPIRSPAATRWSRDTALATGNSGGHGHAANASITNNTTNVAPSTPTLVEPADAARLNTTTPTLTATFLDPDSRTRAR